MCGIAGVVDLGGPRAPGQAAAREDDQAVVRAMCARMRRRGPDDEGFYADGRAVLGHRRLSILDIEGGHQPMRLAAELLGSAPPLVTPPPPARARSFEPRGVAIVQVDGDLTASRSLRLPIVNVRMTGGDSVLQALAETAADPRVRAIVIRIDSPGGSALWADLLARQVQLVRRHKPVICSFGDTAASGGYYLAAPCTEIFASPGTLTGSIGIFGGKVDFSGLLAKVGVHRATFERGPHADMDSLFRPYTDAELVRISGVGERKLQLYGDAFLAEIRKFIVQKVDEGQNVPGSTFLQSWNLYEQGFSVEPRHGHMVHDLGHVGHGGADGKLRGHSVNRVDHESLLLQ